MKKLILIHMLVFAMTTEPMGQALAQMNDQQTNAIANLVKEIKKNTGKSEVSVGDLVRHGSLEQNVKNKEQFKNFLKRADNVKMPKVKAIPIQAHGREAMRLIVGEGKNQMTVEVLNDGDKLFKVGKTIFYRKDLENIDGFLENFGADVRSRPGRYADKKNDSKKMILSFKDYQKLNTFGRIEYMLNLRSVLVAAHYVQQLIPHKNQRAKRMPSSEEVQFALNWVDIMLGKAHAQSPMSEGACVTAGYATSYDSAGTCLYERIPSDQYALNVPVPQDPAQRTEFFLQQCEGKPNLVPCNPRVFGFNSANKPYCVQKVPQPNFQEATKNCDADNMSPLKNEIDTRRLIESLARRRDLFDAQNNIAQNQAAYDEVMRIAGGVVTAHDEAIQACEASQKANPLPYDYAKQEQACIVLKKRKQVLIDMIAKWGTDNRSSPTLGGTAAGASSDCPLNNKPGVTPPPAPASGGSNLTNCGAPVLAGAGGDGSKKGKDEDNKAIIIIGLGVLATGIICAFLCFKPGKFEWPQPPKKDPQPDPKPEPDPDPQPTASEGTNGNSTTGNSGSIRGRQ